MRYGLALIAAAMLLIGFSAVAQQDDASSHTDDNFWVSYWAQPRITLFGQEEADFYKNMHEVAFPWDDFNNPLNPNVLEGDAQWLKDHPTVRLYVSGYASAEGSLVYNLGLSQERADWVKQALVSRGVAEDRIEMAVGWGRLYPVCTDFSDECLSKNRLVRFAYAPSATESVIGQARTAP